MTCVLQGMEGVDMGWDGLEAGLVGGEKLEGWESTVHSARVRW